LKELGNILSETITHELGGQVITFSRITLGIMADFETAMASRKLRTALAELGDKVMPGERAQIISNWASVPSTFGADIYTAAGVRLMLWLCLHANHPEITEDAIGKMVTFDKMDELTALINHLTDPANEPEPNQGNAQTGKEAGQPQS